MELLLKVAEEIEKDELYQGDVWWDDENGIEHAPCVVIRIFLAAGAKVIDVEDEVDVYTEEVYKQPIIQYQNKLYQSLLTY